MPQGDPERIVREDGLTWAVRPGSDDHLAFDHERFMMILLRLPPQGVFIDLGAHIGHFSARLARHASRVVAVEPGPEQLKGLARNLELNGITNVTVVPKAAWDKVARVDLRLDDSKDVSRYHVVEDPQGPIEATTIDALVDELKLPRVDLLKVDIEGAEGHALDGARRTLERFRPLVVLEAHDRLYSDPAIREHYERSLRAAGYEWRMQHQYGGSDYYECLPAGDNDATFARTKRDLRRHVAKNLWRKPYLLAQKVHDRLGLMRLRQKLRPRA